MVNLRIYDFSGRCVATPIADEKLGFGKHLHVFNQQLAAGTYFYEITTGKGVMRRRMMVVD
jgi:hypothetical protein